MDVFRLVVEEHTSGSRVVNVHGELDLATMDILSAALTTARRDGRNVVVDLSPCSFIDSSGIRSLLNGAEEHRRVALELEVVCPRVNQQVFRVLHLVGLGDVLAVRESISDLDRSSG
jgi:anti-anti-sigma factor